MSRSKNNPGKAQKVLRIGIFQNGKFIEERLVRGNAPVTIGQGYKKNTFVVPVSDLPKSMVIIDFQNGIYQLCFDTKMSGRVSLGDGAKKLSDLARSGKAKKSGANWVLPLSNRSKGRVVLGEVTLLFQFVTPPPPRPKPVLPPHMRGGVLNGITGSATLTITCALSMLIQVGFVAFIVAKDWPEPKDAEYVMPDRFVSIMAEEKPEEEELPEENADGPGDVEEEEPKDEPKADDKPKVEDDKPKKELTPEERAAAEAERKRRMAEEVRNKTILGQIGALSSEGGSLVDALSEGAGKTSMEEAFANSAGVTAGTAADKSGLRTSGSSDADGKGSAVGIGSLGGTSASAKAKAGVGTGKKKETKVKVRLNMKSPSKVIGTGKLDAGSISGVLRRRQSALQKCYEREVKKNPKASGKIIVAFTIGRAGRVTKSKSATDSVGGGVGKCVARAIQGFRFPRPKGGEVHVRKTFVFEVAN